MNQTDSIRLRHIRDEAAEHLGGEERTVDFLLRLIDSAPTREEMITQSTKGLVTSPFGSISIPIQEFKRLLTLAGEAAHNHLAVGDPLEDGLLVSKWRAKLVQMGAP